MVAAFPFYNHKRTILDVLRFLSRSRKFTEARIALTKVAVLFIGSTSEFRFRQNWKNVFAGGKVLYVTLLDNISELFADGSISSGQVSQQSVYFCFSTSSIKNNSRLRYVSGRYLLSVDEIGFRALFIIRSNHFYLYLLPLLWPMKDRLISSRFTNTSQFFVVT